MSGGLQSIASFLCQDKCSGKIDAQSSIPSSQGLLLKRHSPARKICGSHERGAVDQDIQSTFLLDNRSNSLASRLLIQEIDRQRPSSSSTDFIQFRCAFLALTLIQVSNRNAGAQLN